MRSAAAREAFDLSSAISSDSSDFSHTTEEMGDTMTTRDDQVRTAQKFAAYVESTNPDAVGIALLFLECGCIQAGPFDADGDQVGPVKHLGQTDHGEIRICPECVDDGGDPQRVSNSAIIFFQPSRWTDEEKESISMKIFSETPPPD